MDRTQITRSAFRLQFYRKWLDTCDSFSDAENCLAFAACDPVLLYPDYVVLRVCYHKFIDSMEVNYDH